MYCFLYTPLVTAALVPIKPMNPREGFTASNMATENSCLRIKVAVLAAL